MQVQTRMQTRTQTQTQTQARLQVSQQTTVGCVAMTSLITRTDYIFVQQYYHKAKMATGDREHEREQGNLTHSGVIAR